MALRLGILAAVAALSATSGWTPDPAACPLDPEDIAVLLAAIAGTDILRRRRR